MKNPTININIQHRIITLVILCFTFLNISSAHATQCRLIKENVKDSQYVDVNASFGGHVAKHVFGAAYYGDSHSTGQTMFVNTEAYNKLITAYFNNSSGMWSTALGMAAKNADVDCPNSIGTYSVSTDVFTANFSDELKNQLQNKSASCNAFNFNNQQPHRCTALQGYFTAVRYTLVFKRKNSSSKWFLLTVIPKRH